MKKFIGWIGGVLAGLIVCSIIVALVLIFFKIPLNLSRFKTPLEALATKIVDRPVTLEGNVVLSTSLTPYVQIQGINIANPDGFDHEHFLQLGQVRLQLALVPLLKRKIQVPEFTVERLKVILQEKADGSVNWLFTATETKSERKKPIPGEQTEKKQKPAQDKKNEFASDQIVIDRLLFKEIEISHFSPQKQEPDVFKVEHCLGRMPQGKPLQLDMKGDFKRFPYQVDLSLASLEELLVNNRSWMDFKLQIADTNLAFNGNVDLAEINRQITLEASVSGKSLSSLNQLVGIDLPPVANYGVSTKFTLKRNRFHLENLALKTGESSLTGEMDVLQQQDKLVVDAKFLSPLIQLDDFLFEDWSWKAEEKKATEAEKKQKKAQDEVKKGDTGDAPSGQQVRKLLDPELLRNYDISMTINAEKVLSGQDLLGKGLLNASLEDGRIAVNPLELHIPGGGINVFMSVQPDSVRSEAAFKAEIENFDIGVLARRNTPDAKMAGLVNLDVDLKTTASTIEEIFANGNGYFDFSGHLDNIRAGIVDLWAVNLVAAIVSSTDENQSEINCAVGRWSMKDGLLSPDVFFIDTSKIRICGKGQVDLGAKKINITVRPTPKKPEFFNLATPVQIDGTFDDINVGIGTGGVLGTAVRFITSPVHVPIRRLVADDIPEDGSDACSIPLGPENRKGQKVQGCR